MSKFQNWLDKTNEGNAEEIYKELKKLEPFKTIKSSTDEKIFIGKAKKLLKKYGIKDWMVDSAVDDFKKTHAGRTIYYIDSSALVRNLIKSGDLSESVQKIAQQIRKQKDIVKGAEGSKGYLSAKDELTRLFMQLDLAVFNQTMNTSFPNFPVSYEGMKITYSHSDLNGVPVYHFKGKKINKKLPMREFLTKYI